VTKEDLTPTIDLIDLDEGIHQVRPIWPTIENITISKVEPETLSINLIQN